MWPEARDQYEKTVALIPADGEAQYFLGKTYFQLREYERAIELYKLAGKLGYNTEERVHFLGKTYLLIDPTKYPDQGGMLDSNRRANLCQAEKQYQELKKLKTQAADEAADKLRGDIDRYIANNRLVKCDDSSNR